MVDTQLSQPQQLWAHSPKSLPLTAGATVPSIEEAAKGSPPLLSLMLTFQAVRSEGDNRARESDELSYQNPAAPRGRGPFVPILGRMQAQVFHGRAKGGCARISPGIERSQHVQKPGCQRRRAKGQQHSQGGPTGLLPPAATLQP